MSPNSPPRADRLLQALRQSPAPDVAAERLLASVQLQVARGELPDFAQQVLPSSSLKVMWLGKLVKTLLLSTLAAGVVTWAAVREEPAPRARSVTLATARAPLLTPTVSPLPTPLDAQPQPVVEAFAPRPTGGSAADTRALPKAAPQRSRTAKAPVMSPPDGEPSRSSMDTLAATLAAPSTRTAETTERAHALQKLAPHDPRDLEEMRRVADAEQLLTRAPERTLQMVREDFERFADGYFHEERRYLEIMALVALGQHDDARALARLFVKRYARGPYRARVEQALALD